MTAVVIEGEGARERMHIVALLLVTRLEREPTRETSAPGGVPDQKGS